MKKTFLFLFLFLTALISSAAIAEDAIVELNVAGVTFKDVIVDIKNFSTVEPVTVGKCTSKNLKHFGEPLFLKDKNLILIPHVKSECLDTKAVNLADNSTFTPTKSTSVFVNFAPELRKETLSVPFALGVFAFDTFLYSSFRYDSSSEQSFTRDYTYIERDIDKLTSVVRVGDIYAFSNSFLVNPPPKQTGITFQRKWVLDPSKTPYNNVSKQVTLNTKSTIEIVQNNIVIHRVELPPGVYSLNNLPTQGLVGTYTIRIIDAFGRVSEQTETYIASRNMLKRGVLDYSISIPLGGYVRYGITDNISAGLHFTADKQSVSVDYLSKLGQTSAEVSTKGDFRLAHLYQKDNISASASFTKKDKENAIAASVSYATKEYGTFSLQLEAKDRTKIGVGWTKSFRNLNVSANANTDGKMSIGGSYYTSIFGRNISLGASFLKAKDENKLYAYLTTPMGEDYSGYGFKTRYSVSQKDSNLEGEINARYVFDYAFKTTFGKETDLALLLRGGTGCVKQDGHFKCGIGSYIYGDQGFVVGDGIVRINNRERYWLNTIQAYRDVKVASSSEVVETEVKLGARNGQGLLMPRTTLVFGKIIAKNPPRSILVDDKEVYVSESGNFSFTTTKKVLKVVINKKVIEREINPIDGIAELEINTEYVEGGKT